MQRLAAEQKAQYGLQVSLEFDGAASLSDEVAACLYSIAHEALINVAKHSGGCEATVRLHVEKDHAYLEIEDHGRGFDPDGMLDRPGHLGQTGMFERAREIDWHLSDASRPGQVTCIRVISNASGGRE